MAFEPKKYSDIYESMHTQMHGVLSDFEVGSVARTMFESFAYELGILYQTMNAVYLSGFVDTAEGTHLDKVVAVLGIQRSLPDYSVGEVTFTRDKSNFDIVIPIGTLVATEKRVEKGKEGAITNKATDDSKPIEVQRKLYKTIEPAELLRNETVIKVKVQALERGESMYSEKDMIVVMPRPIVGIKSVQNENPVKLLGRQLETDDELRRRAKNVLLSSGKGDAAAIENAVLALPEVLSVVVMDDKEKQGAIKVVVDADLTRVGLKTEIETAVNKVRAAGIYAQIEEATLIELAGTIEVKLAEGSVLSEGLQADVIQVLKTFLRSLRMGQPFSLTKLLQVLGTIEGIDDIDLSALKFVNAKSPTNDQKKLPKPAPNERFAIGMTELSKKAIEKKIETIATDKKTETEAIDKKFATMATDKQTEKAAIEKKFATMATDKQTETEAIEKKYPTSESKKEEIEAIQQKIFQLKIQQPIELDLLEKTDLTKEKKDEETKAIKKRFAALELEQTTELKEWQDMMKDDQRTTQLKALDNKYAPKEAEKKLELKALDDKYAQKELELKALADKYAQKENQITTELKALADKYGLKEDPKKTELTTLNQLFATRGLTIEISSQSSI